MMLHPTLALPHEFDETPESYCSRMARRLGRRTRHFAEDIRTTFQSIVDGDPASLGRLVRSCRLPNDAFAKTTTMKMAHGSFKLAGEPFHGVNMTRMRQFVCPVCMREPIAYGRSRWQLESLRVCLEHNCLLVPTCSSRDISKHHDFAWNVAHLHGAERRLPVTEIPEHTFGLARYIIARLDHNADTNWLSAIPGYAVAKFSEVVGLALRDGMSASWHKLSQVDRHLVGSIGYDVLSPGPEGFADYLRNVRARAATSDFGFGSVYGSIYNFLLRNENADYEPFRAILRDHLMRTEAFATGQVVLGQEMPARRWHSIRSINQELDVDVRLVRRRVVALGLVPDSHADLPAGRVLIDAKIHGAMIEKLGELLIRPDAERYIGANRYKQSYLDESIIAPFHSKGLSRTEHLFLKSDLDALMERVTFGAKPISIEDSDFLSIGAASQRANCQSVDVVRLLKEQRLQEVRLDGKKRGVSGLMVNWREVKRHTMRRPDLLSTRGVCYELQCSKLVADRLLRSEIIPSVKTAHPISGVTMRMVHRADAASFKRQFVSVEELAKRKRRSHTLLAKQLAAVGVKPVWGRSETGIPHFRRDAINAVLDTI